MIVMQTGAFAATAQELLMAENWARSRTSLGNAARDRAAFTGRFENLLARSGGGIATRGSRQVLARIVQGMVQNGIDLSEWSIPPNLNESVEIKKKPPSAAVAADTAPENTE